MKRAIVCDYHIKHVGNNNEVNANKKLSVE